MEKKKLICLCLSSLFTIGLITGCGSGTSDKSEYTDRSKWWRVRR